MLTANLSTRLIVAPATSISRNPIGGNLYFTTTDQVTGGGHLSLLDPASGQTAVVADLPFWPAKLIVADDGQTAYITAGNANEIARVNLQTADVFVFTTSGDFVVDLAAVPGHPDTVAASTVSSGVVTIAIYRNGDQQPNPISGSIGTTLQFQSSSRLYAFDQSSSNFKLDTIDVSGTDLSLVSATPLFQGPSEETMAFDGTKLYFSTGEIVNPTTGLVGNMGSHEAWDQIGAEPSRSRLYFVESASLFTYDLNSRRQVGAQTLENAMGQLQGSVVSYGTHGIAFLGTDSLSGASGILLVDSAP